VGERSAYGEHEEGGLRVVSEVVDAVPSEPEYDKCQKTAVGYSLASGFLHSRGAAAGDTYNCAMRKGRIRFMVMLISSLATVKERS
jgi:hypothetical protein